MPFSHDGRGRFILIFALLLLTVAAVASVWDSTRKEQSAALARHQILMTVTQRIEDSEDQNRAFRSEASATLKRLAVIMDIIEQREAERRKRVEAAAKKKS